MTNEELKKLNKLQDEVVEINRKIDLIEDLIKSDDDKTIQCMLDNKRCAKTLVEDEIFIIEILGNIMEYYQCKARVLNLKFKELKIEGEI